MLVNSTEYSPHIDFILFFRSKDEMFWSSDYYYFIEVKVRGRTSCQTTVNGFVSSMKVPRVKAELWERDNGENALGKTIYSI